MCFFLVPAGPSFLSPEHPCQRWPLSSAIGNPSACVTSAPCNPRDILCCFPCCHFSCRCPPFSSSHPIHHGFDGCRRGQWLWRKKLRPYVRLPGGLLQPRVPLGGTYVWTDWIRWVNRVVKVVMNKVLEIKIKTWSYSASFSLGRKRTNCCSLGV